MLSEPMSAKLYIAPLQGFTDAVWRRAHAALLASRGVGAQWTSPFLRIERGELRRRDLRDISPEANLGVNLVPQVIFRDMAELNQLLNAVTGEGYSRVDLNMGCPFPPQVKAGRGAGTLSNPGLFTELAEAVASRPGLSFSIKTRPGVADLSEAETTARQLAGICPLDHITIHPRAASAGYRGEVSPEAFATMAGILDAPLIFNGDITDLEGAERVMERFPGISGIMIGRGALARPSLPAEIAEGREWHPDDRRRAWFGIHLEVARHIIETSAGGTQALLRLKPRLEYTEPELIDRKLLKSLKKATTPERYLSLIPRL